MGEKFKLAIIDNEEGAQAAAIDAAEAAMAENKNELRGVKGIFKKIWKHNLAKEYYRQKEIAKTKELIFESGNVYAAEQGSKLEHDEAMDAIVSRFTSEYDDMVHIEAGEKKEVLDENKPEEKELKEDITTLIKDYASGNINEQVFKEEKIRLFQEASTNEKNVLDKSSMYADNLLTVAKQIKESIDHGQRLEDMDLDFEIIIGKAKSGVRTEANYNKIDKVVDKISSTKLGSLVNETTIAGAVGAAYCLGTALSQKLASSKLFAIGSLGAATALAGGISAVKESKRLEDERRQHNRELAQGKEFSAKDSKRRVEMEEFRYDTESAGDLQKRLDSCLYAEDGSLKEISQSDLDAALGNLVDIEARIKVSDQHKIDLISFSNLKNIEQERLDLDISRAKAKVNLRNMLAQRSDLTLPTNEKFDNNLANLTMVKVEDFYQAEGGIEEKDKLFKKMKAKQMVKTALKTVAIGVSIGTTFQELGAMFSENQQGAIERVFDGQSEGKSATAFEGLRRWIVGGDSPRMNAPLHEEIINGGHFKLPEGTDLSPNPDGTYNLMNGEEMLANNLKLNPNGSLSDEAKFTLATNNILATEDVVTTSVEQPLSKGSDSVIKNMSSEEFIKNKPSMFHEVKRDLWFDNDTKAFDKNELKTWWGGDKNTGLDDKGNYIFNVEHMSPKGSYHGDQSVNAQELFKTGKLKMVFSLSRETQNMVCEVPIDANGNAIIDKDSELGKLLFANENGKAKFLGKFAEVVQSTGQNPDGTEKIRMLSTVVGDGIKNVDQSVIEQIQVPPASEQLAVPLTTLDIPVDAPLDLPVVFPIMPRAPLEKAFYPDAIAYGSYGYNSYYGNNSAESDKTKKYFSSTLEKDPQAELDHYQETENYLNSFDDQYKEEIKSLAEQVKPMKETIKLSICIPAAGHQEGENIYKSLENYSKQTAGPEQYEICILVNHPDVDREGKKIKPDKTVDEIKRFQEDHPDMNIRCMYKVLPFAEAKIGKARKMLNDAQLLRNHERGKDAPDLIMVSNDADNEGIAPEYVENFIKKFESDKKADAMLGQLDWDPAAYVKYPAIYIGTRLMQYMEIHSRIKKWGPLGSSGANFAFRSSIYAAVGGYQEGAQLGEDTDFGAAIRDTRGAEAIKFAGSRVSRLFTSARRSIDAWKQNRAPIEQWNSSFSAFDDKVRKFNLNKDRAKINFKDKKYLSILKKELEFAINRTVDRAEEWGNPLGKGNDQYRMYIDRLGIKYKLDAKGDIVIEDMSRLVTKLKKYQKLGVPLRDYKSGKLSKKAIDKIIKKTK